MKWIILIVVGLVLLLGGIFWVWVLENLDVVQEDNNPLDKDRYF